MRAHWREAFALTSESLLLYKFFFFGEKIQIDGRVDTLVDTASSLLNKFGQTSRSLSLMASVEALSSR